mmetsp:Transcript_10415/g.28677  ORF Transcript_10415/g.28677 Transcript_10415/m.28677 type:complete len:270 (-) Transcript_10415:82-891(-)
MDLIGDYDDSSGSSSSSNKDDDRIPTALHGAVGENKFHSNGAHGVKSLSATSTTADDIQIVTRDEAPPTLFHRTVPHQRGCWWTHVYIPIHPSVIKADGLLQGRLMDARHIVASAGLEGPLVRHEEFHISLSRHFALQQGSIDRCVQALRERLQYERTTCVALSSQNVVLVNDERTRGFVVWRCSHGMDHLKRLVGHVDHVLRQYGVEPYYDPPIFHISIASFPGSANLSNGAAQPSPSDDASPPIVPVDVSNIMCSFGNNKFYTIPLG